MNNQSLYSGLILAFAIVAFIFVCGRLIIEMINNRVKANSPRYKKLLNINSDYSFLPVPKTYTIIHNCSTKRGVENADTETVFVSDTFSSEEVRTICSNIHTNRKLYNFYMNDLTILPDSNLQNIKDSHLKNDLYLKREKKLCEKEMLDPGLDTLFIVRLSYISNKGRSYLKRDITKNYDDLLVAYSQANYKAVQQHAAQDERSKMSAKLRYEVLTRDHFRCCDMRSFCSRWSQTSC